MPGHPAFADLFRTARDTMLVGNSRLRAAVVDRQGTDANVLAASIAAVGDQVVADVQRVEAGSFLDSAIGAALDRLVWDRYGMLRKRAAPAVGTVTFTTTAPAAVAFTIPAGTVLATSTGVQFITTASVTFLVGASALANVPVRSTLAGLDQQAAATTIRNIVGQIPGSPSDLSVSNPDATAGADDDETDTQLRERARRFWLTVRRGTLGAIEVGGLAVAGVRKATAIEVIDARGMPARFVQLVIADAYTDALATFSTPPAYATQSQQLARTVFAGLSDVRAGGIAVQVFVASLIMQPITLRLRFVAGVDVDATALAARAAVVQEVNQLAPGATLDPAALIAVLQVVPGLQITGDEVVSPAGMVVPGPLQVIRTSLSLVLSGS